VSTAALQLFFALLALLVNVATLVLGVLLSLRRRRVVADLLDGLVPVLLPFAFLVATTATLGSLWFSEVVGFVPCKLCWYQRAAVFPLPLLLAGLILRRDRVASRFLLPVTVPGALLSVWHWLVERVPALSGSTSCSAEVPCSVPWFTEFGFVTLAWMAFSTLSFVTVSVLAASSTGRRIH
jgi:disulfide bond formation protein DsbB